jgi:hypothetical protein
MQSVANLKHELHYDLGETKFNSAQAYMRGISCGVKLVTTFFTDL